MIRSLLIDAAQDLKEEFIYLIGANRRFWYYYDPAFAFMGAGLSIAADLVDAHIWNPYQLYITVVCLIVADFFTAVIYAFKQNKFETRKGFRVIYKVVGYTMILSGAHNLAKYESLLSWLPEAVFIPMVVLLFLSLVKNLSLNEWIPASYANILFNKIDKYKDTIIKENETKKPEDDL